MKNFLDVSIDNKRIIEVLEHHNFKIDIELDNEAQKNYKVTNELKQDCLLAVYPKRSGKTSLVINRDSHKIAENICNLIIDELKYFEICNINAMIPVKKEDFEIILSNIKTVLKSHTLNIKEIGGGTQYVISRSREGKFTFKYFTKKNNLQLQGPALGYFNFIAIELQNLGYNIVQYIEEIKEVSLKDKTDIITEYFPNMNKKLPSDVQDITSSSLQLLKINANFPDSSIIFFPMVRTLEHVMRSILDKYGYPYIKGKGFDMFDKKIDEPYTLRRKTGCTMDSTCSDKLSSCYTFYNEHRHLIMHLSEDITERKIMPRDVAVELTLECRDLIEDIGSDFY